MAYQKKLSTGGAPRNIICVGRDISSIFEYFRLCCERGMSPFLSRSSTTAILALLENPERDNSSMGGYSPDSIDLPICTEGDNNCLDKVCPPATSDVATPLAADVVGEGLGKIIGKVRAF